MIGGAAVSVAVEITQFLTYRGMLDVDDLISNVLGAAIGVGISRMLKREKTANWVMLVAGLVGCIMVAVPAAKYNLSTGITQQFQFHISSIDVENDQLTINGICYTYDRATPDYVIFIGGVEIKATVDREKFTAEVAVPAEKSQVQIRFKGYPVMPTGTWLRPTSDGVVIEYVAEDVEIAGVPYEWVLKAYNEEYDVLVYQDGDRLLWMIGSEIDRNTEIIYHIHTTEPEKLPEKRVQYGFDNRGFRVKADEKVTNELESIGHYRVFEKEIPLEYEVTAIVVGFNTDGTITWTDSFRRELISTWK